jgi:hypothetical protein
VKALPGERVIAKNLVRELAGDALRRVQREAELDQEIEVRLKLHADAALWLRFPDYLSGPV